MGLTVLPEVAKDPQIAGRNQAAKANTTNTKTASKSGAKTVSKDPQIKGRNEAAKANKSPAKSSNKSVAQDPQIAGRNNAAKSGENSKPKTDKQKIRDGINQLAARMGIKPSILGTVISYETAGTFDPKKKGPTTKWGQHRGLIQFGEPQAKKYGVDWNDPINSQLKPGGAIERYLKDAGVKPGMELAQVYSAINAGGVKPSDMKKSDAHAGGMPGNVLDKVASAEMRQHAAKAEGFLGGKWGNDAPSFSEPPKQIAKYDTKPPPQVTTPKKPSVISEMIKREPVVKIAKGLTDFFKKPDAKKAEGIIKEGIGLVPGMGAIGALTEKGFTISGITQGFADEIGGLPGRAITMGGLVLGNNTPVDFMKLAPTIGVKLSSASGGSIFSAGNGGSGSNVASGGSGSNVKETGNSAKPSLSMPSNIASVMGLSAPFSVPGGGTSTLEKLNTTIPLDPQIAGRNQAAASSSEGGNAPASMLQSQSWNIAILVAALALVGFGIYSIVSQTEINVEVAK